MSTANTTPSATCMKLETSAFNTRLDKKKEPDSPINSLLRPAYTVFSSIKEKYSSIRNLLNLFGVWKEPDNPMGKLF